MNQEISQQPTKEGHFVRGLGLFSATNIVAGAMIGSGIFIVSQDIAATLNSGGWLLFAWILTGIMSVFVALAYGELAAMYPQAGGQYVYLREAFNPMAGFLYGWTLFMVIQSGSIAAVGVAFAKYSGVLVPGIATDRYLFQIGSFGISTAQLVAIAVVWILTINNCVNLNAGKIVQNVFTVAKIGSLLLIIAVGATLGQADSTFNDRNFFEATAADGTSLGGLTLLAALFTAMVGSMFAADAWNNVTFVAAEVKSPEKNVGRALIFGVGGVILLYILVNISYLNLLPIEAIASAPEQRVAAAAVERLFPWGATAISIIVLISTFGCLNGMILTGPRLYYAMARDGLFFKAAGKLGIKSGVPTQGLIIQGIWSSLLALSGKYGDLLDYVIFAALGSYALTVVGIFVLRRKAPEIPRPYKAWGYPAVPALYVVLATTMMIILLIYKPLYTWPGVLLVASGVPVYYFWKRRRPEMK